MAGLQFHYDGYKRAQPRRGMGLFPSRNHFYYYGVPPVEKERENGDEIIEAEMAKTVDSKDEPEVNNAGEKELKKEDEKGSEILLENLTISEEKLQQIMGRVAVTKNLFDDLLFKIDSIRQIVEIVQENEKRRFTSPSSELVSCKTEPDTLDEILELFQGPVLQNVLRQFLLNIFAGGSNVTKPSAPT